LEAFDATSVIDLYKDLNDQLQNRNAYVVETNETIHVATGSSSNAILLGCALQSKCALFYVAPHMCKNKVAVQACLTALETAQRHIEEHPSTADDALTEKRSVQHMFTRVLNELSRSMEISDTQIALSLLNMGIEVSSDSYHYIGGDYCVNFFSHHFDDKVSSPSQKQQQEAQVKNKNGIEPNCPSVFSDTSALDDAATIASGDQSLDSNTEFVFTNLPADVMCFKEPSAINPSIAPAAHNNQNFGPAAFFSVPLHDDDSNSSICTPESSEDDHTSKRKFQKVPIHYPTLLTTFAFRL